MIDLKSINLPELDADQLERLREDARRLLDGIEQQLEWFNAQAGSLIKPFKFSEDGPVFYAEAVEDGVLINPALPDGFSSTDNAQRSEQERARWWLRPYIETSAWDGPHGLEARERARQSRLQEEGSEYAVSDVDSHMQTQRAQWFSAWPEGVRYDVRCLDGGAWDRPTCWGMFGTLEAAMACINERCDG